jgi:hypothetical protein
MQGIAPRATDIVTRMLPVQMVVMTIDLSMLVFETASVFLFF